MPFPQLTYGINVGNSDLEVSNKILAVVQDKAITTATGVATAGSAFAVKIPMPRPRLITNFLYHVVVIGVALTAGQNFIGYYSVAGATATLVGQTADQSTNFGVTGIKTAALAGGPFSAPGGPRTFGYAVILANGTTGPQITVAQQLASNSLNVGLVAADGLRVGRVGTGLTALPSSFTIASLTDAGNDYAYWLALS